MLNDVGSLKYHRLLYITRRKRIYRIIMPLNDQLQEVTTDTVSDAARTMSANIEIDLNAAMEILSRRSSVLPQSRTIENENPKDIDTPQQSMNGLLSQIGCGCCQVVSGLHNPNGGLALSTEERLTGQLIEIGTATLDDDKRYNEEDENISKERHNEAIASDILDKQEQLKVAQQQAVASQAQLTSTIHSMTINDTISAIFNAQEERVKCYRFFDEVLEYVVDTGNVEYYPLVCADVTATFTVLSSTINAIRCDLGSRTLQSARDIVELITRLQRAEQSKLQLTAALHLERMRRQAMLLNASSKSNGQLNNDDTNQIDTTHQAQPIDSDSQNMTEQQSRIASLLEESIQSLRKKIVLTIEEINDVLDELRYIVVESNDNC